MGLLGVVVDRLVGVATAELVRLAVDHRQVLVEAHLDLGDEDRHVVTVERLVVVAPVAAQGWKGRDKFRLFLGALMSDGTINYKHNTASLAP